MTISDVFINRPVISTSPGYVPFFLTSSLRPAKALLRLFERLGAGHPVSAQHRPALPLECIADAGVVVDDDRDLTTGSGKAAEERGLGHASGSPVTLLPHDQPARGEAVDLEPRLGVGPGALRPAGEIDDLVLAGQLVDHDASLGEHGVIRNAREERRPVLAAALEVAQ